MRLLPLTYIMALVKPSASASTSSVNAAILLLVLPSEICQCLCLHLGRFEMLIDNSRLEERDVKNWNRSSAVACATPACTHRGKANGMLSGEDR
jgi:hypothetical protein